LAKGGAASIFVTESSIAGSLYIWTVLRKLGGDVSVEKSVGGNFFRGPRISGWGDLGKLSSGEAADGLV